MWHVLYRLDTGALVAVARASAPVPPDLGAVPYELEPDLTANQWDPVARMLVPRAPSRGVISRQTFMDRLGQDAVVAVQAAAWEATPAGAALRAWLLRFQVVAEVDVLDPRTIAGVDALIAAGLVPANRRAAILALP